ncbi:MAG: hypothetical protein ACXABV_13950 [Candidatus Thorarchaeota archaeon]|jgi:hypothetical protein
MTNILACLVLETDTGISLYSHFFDKELKTNPNSVPQKIRSGEIKMVHELGKHTVFSALVTKETPAVKPLLQKFRDRVEEVYKEGLKRGEGNFADFVILDNIAKSIFQE